MFNTQHITLKSFCSPKKWLAC